MFTLQVLVALACDLGLDSLPTCQEAYKWSWFRRYCMAARVSTSIERRRPMPLLFCEEVHKKMQEITAEGERLLRRHEDHRLFLKEHDVWLNRSVLMVCHLLGGLLRCRN
jgi:E3 ubiquitin-protein ligase HERC2